jgi:hypothetical protein
MYSAQSAAALAIANAAAALGEQVFNWAVQTQATDTAMTNAAVTNYLNMSGIGLGLAQQQLQQYEGTYVPEMQQLASEAGSYSSAARQAVNAGAAESGTTQAVQQGINNSRMNLQSYGINPSSGMYGELEEAQNAAGGAAAAGAGQEASLATQATGRQLLGESIQVGEQLPGMTVNDLNSAYQGVAGAENAVLANAQTGANIYDAANPFLSTAMQLKYPPIGNTSASQQGSSSQQHSTQQPQQQKSTTGQYGRQPTYGNSGNGPVTGMGDAGSTGANAGQYAGFGGGSGGLGKAGGGAGSIAKTISFDPVGGDQSQTGNGEFGDTTGQGLTQNDVNVANEGSYQNANSPFADPYSAFGDTSGFVDNSSTAMPGGGQAIPYQNAPFSAGGSDFGSFGQGQYGSTNFGTDATTNGGTFDASSGANTANSFTGGDFNGSGFDTSPAIPQSTANADYGSTPYQGGESGSSGNYSNNIGDQSGGNEGGSDYNSGGGGGGGGGGYYARGGTVHGGIPMPTPGGFRNAARSFHSGQRQLPPRTNGLRMTTGGQVPRGASPSRGQQTDDVPARLNAGEFVIPKDVAAWKGHEFFQKMIAQSRKARMGATAKPQMKPPLPNQGRPSFVSRPMNGGR